MLTLRTVFRFSFLVLLLSGLAIADTRVAADLEQALKQREKGGVGTRGGGEERHSDPTTQADLEDIYRAAEKELWELRSYDLAANRGLWLRARGLNQHPLHWPVTGDEVSADGVSYVFRAPLEGSVCRKTLRRGFNGMLRLHLICQVNGKINGASSSYALYSSP